MTLDRMRALLSSMPELPVTDVLDRLVVAAGSHGVVVVQAAPGTGKTTLVPPALAVACAGRVVVTQPRRVAVRAAARRLAHLLGEPVGESVGFSVRGETRTGPRTRVEIVTPGVLIARLRRDPELPGVAAVVLDEVHERQLDSDLALALLVDVRAALRPDLVLVAMSATVEASRTATLLSRAGGAAAPVVTVDAVSPHPVETRWRPMPGSRARLDARGTTPAFWDHVVGVTHEALDDGLGDVLVFVPGGREVDLVVRRLRTTRDGVDVHGLHGRMPARDQDAALAEGGRRRVVVTTAVAESSLTVPGVRVVVDAGLSREPRTDHARGLAGLVTVAVSRAAAEQRAGRAGREGPGLVLRCWSEVDHSRLASHPLPEILTSDLTSFCLEVACWGAPDAAGLDLLDRPPAAALAAAHDVLHALGAIDDAGRVTARGRQIVASGTVPRLARAVLDGSALVGPRRVAEVAALVGEAVSAPGADLVAAWRRLRDSDRSDPAARAWQAQVDRLERLARRGTPARPGSGAVTGRAASLGDDDAAGLVVACAYPDRVARRRPGSDAYLMVQGTGATLPSGSPLLGSPWLAVADADRAPGRRDAVIRAAAPLAEDLALEAAAAELVEEEEVAWVDGRVTARRRTRLGAIVLNDERWPEPPAHLVVAAVRDGLAGEGLGALPWSDRARRLRARLDLLRRTLGPPWPDMSDDALVDALETWLAPDLGRVRRTDDLGRIDVEAALRRLLPWPEAGRLDALVPERMTLPSGSTAAVTYGEESPVLAARVQEVFGWSSTPRVVDGRVPLVVHLLSPAARPVAVTSDLESFWSGPYRQVRAELRGRYPKHDWPEDPTTAVASRGPRRRAREG